MYASDRTAHLDQLVANCSKAMQETLAAWTGRPRGGALGGQTAALDQFAAPKNSLGRGLEPVVLKSDEGSAHQ